MKFLTKHRILIGILILAALLRFYKLGSYPALNADEAAIGYNAYSLLETGKDEHGNPWPVHFQSFNDFKPGGYFYMVMPFVAAFGLNEWSVRVPGAIFGVLTVLVLYLLTKELFRNVRLSLLAGFFLAIFPWHIHFSRGGWEVGVAAFFITLGVYLFLRGLKESKYFALCAIAFVISLYTYHAARVIVPLLGFSLPLVFAKELFSKESKKLLIGSVILAFVLLIPLAHSFLGEAGRARASGVSIFADRGYIDRINEKRGRYENPNSLPAKLVHNKPKEIVLEFSRNYFEHFWGEFLFLSGDDIERNKVPETGELYLYAAPLLLLAFLAISRMRDKKWQPVLWWLLIAPVPAALTFQSPHALRAQNMVIPLAILVACGANTLLDLLQKNTGRKVLLSCYAIFSAIVLWEFSRYVHEYYVHMSKTYPYSSQYGVKEMVSFVNENKNKYDKFVITTRYDQPYILYLFYTKYPPEKFQNNHALTPPDSFGFSTVPHFDKFVFKTVDFEKDKLEYEGAMIIGTSEEIQEAANIVKEIRGTNNYLYFQAVAN